MYYKQHWNRALSEQEIRDLAVSYLHGIVWVLNYYHFGVCSWSWFFPHYFTPLLSGTYLSSVFHIPAKSFTCRPP